MNLTDAERLILINQHELLKVLKPEEGAHCDRLIACLTDGYLRDYKANSHH